MTDPTDAPPLAPAAVVAVNRPVRVHRGDVVSIDPAAGTVTLDIRYHDDAGYLVPSDRAEPLVVPIPSAMPDWCRQPGAEFLCRGPARITPADIADPACLTGFEVLDFWWCTVDELERMIGYGGRRMTEEERVAIEARRPAVYHPPAKPKRGKK